jgi:hypothetical protein
MSFGRPAELRRHGETPIGANRATAPQALPLMRLRAQILKSGTQRIA